MTFLKLNQSGNLDGFFCELSTVKILKYNIYNIYLSDTYVELGIGYSILAYATRKGQKRPILSFKPLKHLQGGTKRMDSLPYYTMLGGYFFLGTL